MTNPSTSGRGAPGSFDSSTRRSVIANAATPIGTLTKKIQRQFRPLVIAPPSTGPTATATPVTAPNAANATPRSRGVNAWASSASAVANMIAPPTPCSALASDRKSELCATPQSAEPSVKTTIPVAKTRRRPARSAIDPAVSSSAASVSA